MVVIAVGWNKFSNCKMDKSKIFFGVKCDMIINFLNVFDRNEFFFDFLWSVATNRKENDPLKVFICFKKICHRKRLIFWLLSPPIHLRRVQINKFKAYRQREDKFWKSDMDEIKKFPKIWNELNLSFSNIKVLFWKGDTAPLYAKPCLTITKTYFLNPIFL